MPDKRCENGHFIDESWDLCPYCPPDQQDRVVPGGPSGVPPTRAGNDRIPASAREPSVERSRPTRAEGPAPPSAQRTVAVGKIPAEALRGTHRYVVGWLVGLNGSLRGDSFELRNGRNVIGRERRCDVSVQDDQVSSHHADLVYRPDEGRFILMDNNSTNGSYVNEVEIEPRRELNGREIIRVGTHRFLFYPLVSRELDWEGEGVLK